MAVQFAPLIKFLFAPFSILGKVLFFVVGTKMGRNGILMVLILLAFFLTPIKTSIQEKDPKIILDVVITRLASGDNGINQEINKAIELKNAEEFGLSEALTSLLRIYLLFHFSFYVIGWAFWKIGNTQNMSLGARNIIFAIVMLILLQVGGSLYILASEHEGNFSSDMKYIIGEKSFLDTLKFLNPIKGIIHFFANIDVLLEPIVKPMERLYSDK